MINYKQNSLLSEFGRKLGVGVFDGLSARLASQYSFDFLWVSSFCVSASRGLPDTGLLSSTELYDVVKNVHNNTTLPIVVDIDSGYGDLDYLRHFFTDLAKLGVAAVCIEDNPLSKICSLYDIPGRVIASIEEHVSRINVIKSVIEETQSNCVVIARTEALVARMGMEEALLRAAAYKNAGADAIFIQSCDDTGCEIISFLREWQESCPVFLTPTKYYKTHTNKLFEAGASHVIYANQLLRSAHKAMRSTCESFSSAPSLESIELNISSLAEISHVVGANFAKSFQHA